MNFKNHTSLIQTRYTYCTKNIPKVSTNQLRRVWDKGDAPDEVCDC